MNRKGMLLASETLKMVLAVISIGFLIYLLSAIYFSSVNDEKKVQAEATVERIKEIANRLNFGEVASESLTDITPFGWNIFVFTLQERKPNFCAGESCFCICDETLFEGGSFVTNSQLEECDEAGVCAVIPGLMEFEDLEIGEGDASTSLSFSKKGNLIEVKKI